MNIFTPAEEFIYEYQSWHSSQMMSIKAKEVPCQPNLWKLPHQLRRNWWAHYEGGAHQLTAVPWARVCSCQQRVFSCLWAQSSRGIGILYMHPLYWLINKALWMYEDVSSKTPSWLFYLLLILRAFRACPDSPVLLLQTTNNKQNPIAMLHDYFNVLLLVRDDFPRLNLTPFSKKAVL